jgi:hypothetical protein
MLPDFLQPGKRHDDPCALLAQIVKMFPNNPAKQKQLFFCMVLDSRRCLHRVVEDVFERWTTRGDQV